MSIRQNQREALVDALLEEALGGHAPRDFSAEILAKATQLEAARTESLKAELDAREAKVVPIQEGVKLQVPRSQRGVLIAASIAGVLALAAALFFTQSDDKKSFTQPTPLEAGDSDNKSVGLGNDKREETSGPQESESNEGSEGSEGSEGNLASPLLPLSADEVKEMIVAARRAFSERTSNKHIEALVDTQVQMGQERPRLDPCFFSKATLREAYLPDIEINEAGRARLKLDSSVSGGALSSFDWLYIPSSDVDLSIEGVGVVRSTGSLLLWRGAPPQSEAQIQGVLPFLQHYNNLSNEDIRSLSTMKHWKTQGTLSLLLLSGAAIFAGNTIEAANIGSPKDLDPDSGTLVYG
ncbi:MAG: hypothetical protein KDB07_11465, partial [Planctomycetes bacterium]|nr:hypothetical protein [Planctomycetota bacterium]